MNDLEKVIEGLEWILEDDRFGFGEGWAKDDTPECEEEQAGYNIVRALESLREYGELQKRHKVLVDTCDDMYAKLKERSGAQLYIRDNVNGKVHKYGDNQHDALILEEDGSINYYNLQTGCGSMFPEEGYSFCFQDGTTPDSLGSDDAYLDIGGHAVTQNKTERKGEAT